MSRDPLTERVIGCSIEVHRVLGPGLLESAYEQCLAHELAKSGCAFRLQVPIPIEYKGVHIDCGYRIDLLVEDRLVVEIKSIEAFSKIHHAQILTYMRLADIETGLLINFNKTRLVDGIKRFKL